MVNRILKKTLKKDYSRIEVLSLDLPGWSDNNVRHVLQIFCVLCITNEMRLSYIQCSLLLSTLYMFRAGLPPIIRSL